MPFTLTTSPGHLTIVNVETDEEVSLAACGHFCLLWTMACCHCRRVGVDRICPLCLAGAWDMPR